ncbi:MAG: type I-E CRISPR-associated protein Cse2/CasB [Treponema sp.]|jgi:CRISPR system Cascade subunit CasB|nr:type I-E CRISPR-associated protein Cse2/CasB [Treponema sp.]
MAKKDKPKSEAFVNTVIEKLKGPDTAFGAALRRADNPATKDQSWEYLCPWCDITKGREYNPFALIGAALAKAKPDRNGDLGIGKAIARCYSDGGTSGGNEQPAAKIKLRRLLACHTAEEACGILRSLLGLIKSRGIALDYAGLLKDLLSTTEYFNEIIKAKWARDFYYKKGEE